MSLPWVQIDDHPESREYAGRRGHVFGHSVPSSSGVGPVIGAHLGGSARADWAIAVYFPDAGETVWFSPVLVLHGSAADVVLARPGIARLSRR